MSYAALLLAAALLIGAAADEGARRGIARKRRGAGNTAG